MHYADKKKRAMIMVVADSGGEIFTFRTDKLASYRHRESFRSQSRTRGEEGKDARAAFHEIGESRARTRTRKSKRLPFPFSRIFPPTHPRYVYPFPVDSRRESFFVRSIFEFLPSVKFPFVALIRSIIKFLFRAEARARLPDDDASPRVRVRLNNRTSINRSTCPSIARAFTAFARALAREGITRAIFGRFFLISLLDRCVSRPVTVHAWMSVCVFMLCTRQR